MMCTAENIVSLSQTSTQTTGRSNSEDSAADLFVALKDGEFTLDLLMQHALQVPGAAAALLDAFAAQARALRLVQEADARGAASLPSELRQRIAAAAARTPSWLAVGSAGVRV